MTEISSASCLASWLGGQATGIRLRASGENRTAGGTDTEKTHCARMICHAAPALCCHVFRALAAVSFAGAWPGRIADIRQAARSAAREARDAMSETYNEGQMNVVGSREAIPEEYLYIHEIEADANALGVVLNAVDAIGHAVQTGIDLVDASRGLAGFDAVFESVISTGNAADRAVDGANGHLAFSLCFRGRCRRGSRDSATHLCILECSGAGRGTS